MKVKSPPSSPSRSSRTTPASCHCRDISRCLLREECDRRGIVLIFDEIVTGFPDIAGRAQDLFGIVPDIAVYSKALGGGLPIAAFAGRRDIMELIGKNTVKHGGTYNGNPLCCASALHTLATIE